MMVNIKKCDWRICYKYDSLLIFTYELFPRILAIYLRENLYKRIRYFILLQSSIHPVFQAYCVIYWMWVSVLDINHKISDLKHVSALCVVISLLFTSSLVAHNISDVVVSGHHYLCIVPFRFYTMITRLWFRLFTSTTWTHTLMST